MPAAPPDFDPGAYPPAVAALLGPSRRGPLGPGTPRRESRAALAALGTADLAPPGATVRDPAMAAACLAGLWLLHDYLDESHRLSQDIDTPTGSYWHGIMHRREPDYGNAKYWFRRVGSHPVLVELGRAVGPWAAAEPSEAGTSWIAATAAGGWDPLRFVDLCEAVERGRSGARDLAEKIQAREWELLFAFCHQRAFEPGG